MAQDAVAPRAHGDDVGWFRSAVMALRRLDLVPKTPALGPVDYKNVGLVAYVGATVVGAVAVAGVAVLTVRVQLDLLTLAIAGATIFLMSVFAVRLAPPANVSWVPTAFVHLGLAVTFGPAGAAVGALAEPLGVSIRSRNGWFRRPSTSPMHSWPTSRHGGCSSGSTDQAWGMARDPTSRPGSLPELSTSH